MVDLKSVLTQVLQDTKTSSDLIDRIKQDIYADVDGFYKYFPKNGGYLDEYHLVLIAAILHDMNKDWDDEIKRYFEQHPVF